MENNQINKSGFVRRKNYDTLHACIMIAIVTAVIVLAANFTREKKKNMAIPVMDSVKVDSIPVTITIYNCVSSQTDASPMETADGSIIDPDNPERWCAVSRDLLNYFSYGDTITLFIPQVPYIASEWVVHDTMNKRLTKTVDLLISNNTVCLIEGRWAGYILVKKP